MDMKVGQQAGGHAQAAGRHKESKGSRRRRLWELEHKHHCLVVGVCFEVQALRQLVSRLVKVPQLISDFELHRCAVQACERRSKTSELLHKDLERRYALTLNRLKACPDALALQGAWRAAMAAGEVAATLWAILSHPRCDEALADMIYGEMHMLQHQVGCAQRIEQFRFQALQRENATLLRELANVQARTSRDRDERVQEVLQLRREVAANHAERVGRQEQLARLQHELSDLREQMPDMSDRERLLKRAHGAEAQCQALRAHAQMLERQLEIWQKKAQPLLQAQAMQAKEQPVCQERSCAESGSCDLKGKQVLCIGGRPGVIEFYRQLVEGQGGSFAHHDGGLEENIAQIEPSIAAADAVICQAGCINHNAYWRVKDYCKRTGKPCVFLKSSGVGSFQRGLTQLASARQMV